MKKAVFILGILLVLLTSFLSGCIGTSGSDVGTCLLIVIIGIIIFILVIAYLLGPKKNKIIVQTSTGQSVSQPETRQVEPKPERKVLLECDRCGKRILPIDATYINKNGRRLTVCHDCGEKILKDKTEDLAKKSDKEDEAIKTLKLRYAKGEITKEEYEQMKKDLED